MCGKCKKELMDFGAILFGPPGKNDIVKKTHMCQDCYKIMIKGFE